MSKQVRDLVERSVNHFAEYFAYYSVSMRSVVECFVSRGLQWLTARCPQEGNAFEGEYKDYTFNKTPLLRIKVTATPGSTALAFEPTPDQMKLQVGKWFQAIINVNYQLPSIDAIMYPGDRAGLHLLRTPWCCVVVCCVVRLLLAQARRDPARS